MPGNVFFGLSGGFFIFFTGSLTFCFHFYSLVGAGGVFYGLFVPGGVFLSFRVGFLLFHGFSLVCFYPLRVFWFLYWAASALSLWVVVLLFHGLSCLLLCFIALLLSVNRVLNPVCGIIRLSYILP